MTIDEYVNAVLVQLPRQLVDRERVEADLRAHVADRMEAGASQEEAVSHLGQPADVAGELLATVRLQPAARSRRLGAFLIDCMIGALPVGLVCMFVVFPMLFRADFALVFPSTGMLWVWGIAMLVAVTVPLLALLYFPVLEKAYGQTAGKWALGLVVVRENGATLRWRDAIIRRLPFVFEFFWLDAIFALFTAKRQRAFDFVASTVVVQAEPASHIAPTPVAVV